MQLIPKAITIALALSMLQSCADMNKQGGGSLIGGITGGLVGSQFGKGTGALAATGIGVLAGAMIGGHIGKTMDDYDKRLLQSTSQDALERARTGDRVEWRNPDSGNHGYITPTNTFRDNGQYCREYTQVVVVGGQQEKAYGRACRKPDGHWEIVK